MFDLDAFTKKFKELTRDDQHAARNIGISYEVLYNLRNGTYAPKAKIIRAICRTYDVKANWLLGIKAKGKHDCMFVAFKWRFRTCVENSPLTQIAMINELDMSSQTFYNYLKGKTEPAAGIICNLCEYYHVSADWLLGLID